ncbi:MAG TPA: ornithine cyclodeaminase family protein [Candidatus Limnocylindria bacterium]|nr:ornithine cyclodeaminase family protein [Candidatus Limnocylindria bacterium]
MRLIRAADLERACSMADAIDAVAQGFIALSDGRAHVPVRIHIPIEERGLVAAMPASLDGSPYYVVKVVGIAPAAPRAGLPLISATVVLGDAATGAPLALLEGAALTALRTGAAGGVAARALAAPDARVVALFGAGAQARTQLDAVRAVRAVEDVRVTTRDPRHASDFVLWARTRHPDLRIRTADAADSGAAVDGADIVVAATSSASPVFAGSRLAPGTHVTGVGSHRPDMRELDADTIHGARVVVDQRAGALAEAGELQGLRGTDVVEIGEVLGGTAPGRTSREERTVFKSVGNGIQDLVVAALAYDRAKALGLGEEISWP